MKKSFKKKTMKYLVYYINYFIFAIYLHISNNMKHTLITFCILFITWLAAYTQENTENIKTQKMEAMEKLSFMAGTWEGKGWTQMGEGSKETFDVHETIEKKLDGLVYLVEGHGTSAGITTHKAIAIISWNSENNEYSFESHTFDGRSADATASLEGRTFTWGFSTPNGGEVRYKMIFNNSEWHETGSYSPDGQVWYPFMEMRLKKITE